MEELPKGEKRPASITRLYPKKGSKRPEPGISSLAVQIEFVP